MVEAVHLSNTRKPRRQNASAGNRCGAEPFREDYRLSGWSSLLPGLRSPPVAHVIGNGDLEGVGDSEGRAGACACVGANANQDFCGVVEYDWVDLSDIDDLIVAYGGAAASVDTLVGVRGRVWAGESLLAAFLPPVVDTKVVVGRGLEGDGWFDLVFEGAVADGDAEPVLVVCTMEHGCECACSLLLWRDIAKVHGDVGGAVVVDTSYRVFTLAG